MGVTFTKEQHGPLNIVVDGLLTFNDQKEVERRIHEEIDDQRKIKLLVLAQWFGGWSQKGDWGDMSFMQEHDPFIEKIAVVAHQKWRDQILMFMGAGIRQAKVEFFTSGDEEKARGWLQSED